MAEVAVAETKQVSKELGPGMVVPVLVSPVLKRQRQRVGDCKFKANVGYLLRPCFRNSKHSSAGGVLTYHSEARTSVPNTTETKNGSACL